MIKASFKKYKLQFTSPILTSRGSMTHKNGYYLFINNGTCTGIGECSFIEGLSTDNLGNYEITLQQLCSQIQNNSIPEEGLLANYPSIKFGYEMAMRDMETGGRKVLFDSDFTEGKKNIPINGLVWMGHIDFMFSQVTDKLKQGFKCIKVKVGAIDFNEEISILKFIRSNFPADVIEIRLDANGAFGEKDVFQKLETLSAFDIHSIEQPVKAGQTKLMAKVCSQSPIPVALDEELIGARIESGGSLLSDIKPRYIILKPSLLGGFTLSEQWIKIAGSLNIGWWATSALESNIGLNAIAQWAFTKPDLMAQGLGTGGLYTNNLSSPLYIKNGELCYMPGTPWGNI
jgi:o-succinylbenzoate synthase